MFTLQLKEMRKRAGYKTQKAAADALGIKERKYASWERGEVQLTLEDAFNIGLVFGCTPNDLCGWSGGNGDASFSDSGQAALTAYYESMNDQGRETLVQTARLMSGSPDTRIQKDGAEHVRVQEAM